MGYCFLHSYRQVFVCFSVLGLDELIFYCDIFGKKNLYTIKPFVIQSLAQLLD